MHWYHRLAAFVLAGLMLGLSSLVPPALPAQPKAASAGPLASATYAAGTGFDYGAVAFGVDSVRDLGFRWTKVYLPWRAVQPTPDGPMNWGATDSPIAEARARGIKVLALVFDPPDWALSTPNRYAPPRDDRDLANFMVAAATHYRGQVAAYELWNEQNQASNWGNQRPSPERYTQMLRAVYPRLKGADPSALLVTGGLATAGGGDAPDAMGDLLYIKYLYRPSRPPDPAGPCSEPAAQADLANGARGYFDALAVHPYGGPWEPERSPAEVQYVQPGVYFRRAEQARQMMEIWGCDDKPVFATEFGWLVQPSDNGVPCGLDPYFAPFVVSQDQKAQYLVRAYEYARQNWPWMGPMFLMNVDFATRWNSQMECTLGGWSLLRRDGSPSPAYTALKNLVKAPADNSTPQLSASSVTLLTEPGRQAQAEVDITNAAFLATTTWTAGVDQPWLQARAVPYGFAISANMTGLPVGSYSGQVTISFPGLGSQLRVPVRVVVASPLYWLYLPEISRR